jgi:hypothetical protein
MVSEETKNGAKTKIYREIPIKNPFIRENKIWDSDNELFDKIKVSLSHDGYITFDRNPQKFLAFVEIFTYASLIEFSSHEKLYFCIYRTITVGEMIGHFFSFFRFGLRVIERLAKE